METLVKLDVDQCSSLSYRRPPLQEMEGRGGEQRKGAPAHSPKYWALLRTMGGCLPPLCHTALSWGGTQEWHNTRTTVPPSWTLPTRLMCPSQSPAVQRCRIDRTLRKAGWPGAEGGARGERETQRLRRNLCPRRYQLPGNQGLKESLGARERAPCARLPNGTRRSRSPSQTHAPPTSLAFRARLSVVRRGTGSSERLRQFPWVSGTMPTRMFLPLCVQLELPELSRLLPVRPQPSTQKGLSLGQVELPGDPVENVC